MLVKLLIAACELAAGGVLWWLFRQGVIMAMLPGWCRFLYGVMAAVVIAAAFQAFLGDVARLAPVLEPMPVNLILGYAFGETLHLNTPANWARWRRFKRDIMRGEYYDHGDE